MEYTNYNPAPWYKDRKVRIFAIALVLVVIVGVVLVLVVSGLRRSAREAAVAEFERVEIAEGQIAMGMSACETATDPEACRAQLIQNAATDNAAIAVCDELSEADRTECVFEIAYNQRDVTLCETDLCRDNVRVAKAREDRDLTQCRFVSDETLRTSCEDQVRPYVISAGGCDDGRVEQQYCDAMLLTKEAVNTGDLGVCDRLSGDDADDCRSAVVEADQDGDRILFEEERELGLDPFNPDGDADRLNDGDELDLGTDPFNADSDGDGLLDGEEVEIGSDPLNPDTDGDGFSDGEEMQNGFSPLGPGTE